MHEEVDGEEHWRLLADHLLEHGRLGDVQLQQVLHLADVRQVVGVGERRVAQAGAGGLVDALRSAGRGHNVRWAATHKGQSLPHTLIPAPAAKQLRRILQVRTGCPHATGVAD